MNFNKVQKNIFFLDLSISCTDVLVTLDAKKGNLKSDKKWITNHLFVPKFTETIVFGSSGLRNGVRTVSLCLQFEALV